MNISREELITTVNSYVEKMHDIICAEEEELSPLAMEKLQHITEDIFDSCAKWDISFEDELDNPMQFFVLNLVRNTRLASALCGSADKEGNKKMKEVTQDHFRLHLEGLKEGVCVYYHGILKNREVN